MLLSPITAVYPGYKRPENIIIPQWVAVKLRQSWFWLQNSLKLFRYMHSPFKLFPHINVKIWTPCSKFSLKKSFICTVFVTPFFSKLILFPGSPIRAYKSFIYPGFVTTFFSKLILFSASLIRAYKTFLDFLSHWKLMACRCNTYLWRHPINNKPTVSSRSSEMVKRHNNGLRLIMRSSKTGRKRRLARSDVLLKPNVANILLFNFCEQKFVHYGPITIAIDCNGLSLLVFEGKWPNDASVPKSAPNSDLFGCFGFSKYACRFTVPQIRQFCWLTYPPRSKWASSEKMIFFPKSAFSVNQ